MILSIGVCLVSLLLLIWQVRIDRVSLGLPIAYLCLLLFNHLPGALAHALSPELFRGDNVTEIGLGYAAIGSLFFVGGVSLARFQVRPVAVQPAADRKQFWIFCLAGGWLFVYGLSALHSIPSVGALVDEGGAIWMLGVLLGLRSAIQKQNYQSAIFWLSALLVYPTLMLLLGGFLSYGTAAAMIVCSALTVSVRSYWRVFVGVVVVAFLGLNLFVNYFHHRDAIREEVWGGAPMEARVASVTDMFTDFSLYDPTDRLQAASLDARLNQNRFIGLAAERIDRGQVSYLYGSSLWDGMIAMVPRLFWPSKPVTAGSGTIVSEMTGLTLSRTTSWGVGNVMEFEINFGAYGVILGFLGLGWLIGFLDRKAAAAERCGELGLSILYFLPAVALINPIGSIVELSAGAVASLLAAHGWNLAWKTYSDQKRGSGSIRMERSVEFRRVRR